MQIQMYWMQHRIAVFVFAQQTIAVQRFTVGARFLIGVLQLIPEATFSGNQSSYFLNLGLRI